MAASNTRFIVIDKFFASSTGVDSHLLWHMHNGTRSVVRRINMNNHIYHSLYVFVRPGYHLEMSVIINQIFDTGRGGDNTTFVGYTYPNLVNVKTTTNMWASISSNNLDQHVYGAKVFRLTSNTSDGIAELHELFLRNQELCTGIYHCYRPINL